MFSTRLLSLTDLMANMIALIIFTALANRVACQSAINFTKGTNVPDACICVTSGHCSLAGGNMINDGAGYIQGRVLNTGATPDLNSTIGNLTGIKPAHTGIDLVADSQDTCGDNLDNCCPSTGVTCGIRYPPVTIAPTAVSPQASYGAYPFHVAIFSNGNFIASGVLIDHMHVLTAAHKIVNVPLPLMIRVGAWNLPAAKETLDRYDIISYTVVTHPSYNSKNLKNDISLIRLTVKAPLGKIPTISNICLPNFPTEAFYGMRCWVSGWGQVNSSSPTSILNEVDVPIMDPRTCQRLLRNTTLGSTFVLDSSTFVCAGGEGGKDSCSGDAGAPLSCFVGDRFYLVGLVAWGVGCGQVNVPGVYVNIPAYLPWIQRIVAQLSGLQSSTLASSANKDVKESSSFFPTTSTAATTTRNAAAAASSSSASQTTTTTRTSSSVLTTTSSLRASNASTTATTRAANATTVKNAAPKSTTRASTVKKAAVTTSKATTKKK